MTAATCSVIKQARTDLGSYADGVIQMVIGPVLVPPAGSEASAILRLGVIHGDSICRVPLADACIFISVGDPAIRFVAPDVGYNYVSYLGKSSEPPGQLAF